MNFATETFVSNEISKINFTIPENYVRNNVKTDFTYVPTISGIDIATKTYVDEEVSKIPKVILPETMVKTDIENNFTVTPKINGTNMATVLDISNSISQIPSYNLPSNVVKKDTPTDFTVVPQINGKDITTKEYVDNEVAKVNYTLPSTVVHNNTLTDFTVAPTINNIPIATQKYVNDKLDGIKFITLSDEGVFTVTDEKSYYIENVYADTETVTNKLNKIKGGNVGDIINIRLTKNLEVIHNNSLIILLNNKSLLKTDKIKMDSNKFLTFICLIKQTDTSDSIWMEFNRSWGYEPNDYSNVAKLSANNIFTGTNTMTNINFKGQISYSNNPLFLFRYMNIGGTNTSVFHLGNDNFPLNLLAKDNKVFLNGTEVNLKGSNFEMIFDGLITIPIVGNYSDSGIVAEYDYSQLVSGKNYNFICFKVEDNNNLEFNFLINFGNNYCSNILCLKGENIIEKISFEYNNFYVKVDDSSKKLYVTATESTLANVYIKNIAIF